MTKYKFDEDKSEDKVAWIVLGLIVLSVSMFLLGYYSGVNHG